MGVNSLRDAFDIVAARTPELRDVAYRIRYRVYCQEFGFEDSRRFPEGRETDLFDKQSEHCLIFHRKSNRYVGCVRLVLPDKRNPYAPLPFELACGTRLNSKVMESARKSDTPFGELSRVALLPGFRHRPSPAGASDSAPPGARCRSEAAPAYPQQRYEILAGTEVPSVAAYRQSFPCLDLGLYLAGAAMVLSHGLRSVFAMMEPRLARRLRMYGIHFEQVGDVIDYHGLRGPFQITPEGLFAGLCPGFREFLDGVLLEVQQVTPLETAVS
jgi:hypothetical protein